MQTLFLKKSECENGKLPNEFSRIEFDVSCRRIVGVSVLSDTGVDECIDDEDCVRFDAYHIDCNCEMTFDNAKDVVELCCSSNGCCVVDDAAVYREVLKFIEPRSFSKLKIYIALAKVGIWERFVKELSDITIDGVNAYVAFSMANEITEEHPLFVTLFELVASKLGIDIATAKKMLSECVL